MKNYPNEQFFDFRCYTEQHDWTKVQSDLPLFFTKLAKLTKLNFQTTLYMLRQFFPLFLSLSRSFYFVVECSVACYSICCCCCRSATFGFDKHKQTYIDQSFVYKGKLHSRSLQHRENSRRLFLFCFFFLSFSLLPCDNKMP